MPLIELVGKGGAAGKAAMMTLNRMAAWLKRALLGSAPARPLCLLRARLAAPGSSVRPGRGPATGTSATALGARASCLQRALAQFTAFGPPDMAAGGKTEALDALARSPAAIATYVHELGGSREEQVAAMTALKHLAATLCNAGCNPVQYGL